MNDELRFFNQHPATNIQQLPARAPEQRILAFVVLKIYLASHALSKKRGQSVSDGVSRASLGVLAFPTLAVLRRSHLLATGN